MNYNLLFLHSILLFLLPLPTMAMKKGEGLRKGDAHGVPGKTMLNGDRPVPLPPGTNAAPKVQSILHTESSRKEKRVQSLLVVQETNWQTNKRDQSKKRVPSLLLENQTKSISFAGPKYKQKPQSLIENVEDTSGKEKRLAQSLLSPAVTPHRSPATSGSDYSAALVVVDEAKNLVGRAAQLVSSTLNSDGIMRADGPDAARPIPFHHVPSFGKTMDGKSVVNEK